MSQLRVCLSAEGAKNVSWPWLSPIRGWGSVAMTFTGKFVYIYTYTHIHIHTHTYIYETRNTHRAITILWDWGFSEAQLGFCQTFVTVRKLTAFSRLLLQKYVSQVPKKKFLLQFLPHYFTTLRLTVESLIIKQVTKTNDR